MAKRIEEMAAADYVDLIAARAHIIHAVNAATAPYDALVMPTTANTPMHAAKIANFAATERFSTLLD